MYVFTEESTRALFSPEILQAGAAKGLIAVRCIGWSETTVFAMKQCSHRPRDNSYKQQRLL